MCTRTVQTTKVHKLDSELQERLKDKQLLTQIDLRFWSYFRDFNVVERHVL